MNPIPVPAPPKSAYNPNRPVSDLLRAQLKHFQHVELKSGVKIDAASKQDLATEAGAARYIAEMTRAIRGRSAAQPAGIAVMPAAIVKAKKAKGGLALAAGAAKKPRKGKKS